MTIGLVADATDSTRMAWCQSPSPGPALDGTKFLGDDHTYATPSGGGSTSVEDDDQTVQVDPASKLQFEADDFAASDGSGVAKVTFSGTAVAGARVSHEDGGADEVEIANLPTSETQMANVLHPDGLGGVAWGTDATGGGGGGVSWTQDVNEPGASFANFTVGTGTWAGTIISQTATTAAALRVRHNNSDSSGIRRYL